jgi:hypothetical protein
MGFSACAGVVRPHKCDPNVDLCISFLQNLPHTETEEQMSRRNKTVLNLGGNSMAPTHQSATQQIRRKPGMDRSVSSSTWKRYAVRVHVAET